MMTFDIFTKLAPALFVTSTIPGLCMTLAMSLGMTVGVRKTMWMMVGELTGVAIVVSTIILGAAEYIHSHQELFNSIRIFGAMYLCYVAVKMWQKANSKFELQEIEATDVKGFSLLLQGFFTAISNPKLWIFMVSLIPPFISSGESLAPQMSLILAIILTSEFTMLMIYASGGSGLKKVLSKSGNVRWLYRSSGSIIFLLSIWMVLD